MNMHYVYAQDKQYRNISVQNCNCTWCLHTHIYTFLQLLQKKRKKTLLVLTWHYNIMAYLYSKLNKTKTPTISNLLSLFDIVFANILYEISYMCFWLCYINQLSFIFVIHISTGSKGESFMSCCFKNYHRKF